VLRPHERPPGSVTMDSQRYSFKLAAKPGAEIPDRDLVLFFHRLIQDKAVQETCIDVADYTHVPDGPGVMLICHEAHYSLERAGGQLGLRCAGKRGFEGDARARIRRVLRKTLHLAHLAETHEVLGGRLQFDTSNATFWLEDRLIAPSTEATFAAFAPVLAETITGVWGASPILVRGASSKEPFRVDITSPVAPGIVDLLGRL